MTADDVRALLRSEIARAGTAKSWSESHGMSPQYVSDVLNGLREPSYRIMAALKLKRELVYRKIGE